MQGPTVPADAYEPISHGLHAVKGLASWSEVPAGHCNRLQMPNDPVGTKVPLAQGMQAVAELKSWSVIP